MGTKKQNFSFSYLVPIASLPHPSPLPKVEGFASGSDTPRTLYRIPHSARIGARQHQPGRSRWSIVSKSFEESNENSLHSFTAHRIFVPAVNRLSTRRTGWLRTRPRLSVAYTNSDASSRGVAVAFATAESSARRRRRSPARSHVDADVQRTAVPFDRSRIHCRARDWFRG